MEQYQRGLLTDPDLAATRLGPRWHHVLRRLWLRTQDSRGDLALFQCGNALVAAFVVGLLAFTGIVDREFIWVSALGCPLVFVLGWIGFRELRHLGSGSSEGEARALR